MTKALYLVLAALLIVAAFGFEMEEDEDFDVEFMKRNPEWQEFLLAEKRGRNLKKYKPCVVFNQECRCQARSGKVVYCEGAGNGAAI